MHPEISKFPVGNFYDGKVSDGPNVVCKNYERKFLPGKMFGSYSFINVEGGHETTEKHGQSLKNTVEVAAVLWIVKQLFEGMIFCVSVALMLRLLLLLGVYIEKVRINVHTITKDLNCLYLG
jgi:hypothetical protein